MNALLRPTFSVSGAMAPATSCNFVPATLVRMDDDGQALVLCSGAELRAAVASHLPGLVNGQMVLLATVAPQEPAPEKMTQEEAVGLAPPPLVIAAWPSPGAPIAPPWHFDRGSGTLTLAATTLELGAVNSILLNCGDARMQFTRDGCIETRGQSITSAAIETHRIEGGSIELN